MTRLAILGLGLIGGSLAAALKQFDPSLHITAYDPNELTLAHAKREGLIDAASPTPQAAVSGADIVLLAAPLPAYAALAEAIAPALRQGIIVTDVGSVKQAAIEAVASHLPEHSIFVPAHPIAGSEQSGIHAARADLFARRRVLITPLPDTPPEALQTVAQLWQAADALVETLPADAHDLIYSYVSHLPQLLAFAAAETMRAFIDATAAENDITLRRFLRLSGSNPELWQGIFTANAANVFDARAHYLNVLDSFLHELSFAPEPAQATDWPLVAQRLFPRLASTCLAATVMQIAAATGLTMARYGGTGFADFLAPSESAPEDDMESISQHHHAVVAMLQDFRERLVKPI